MKKVHSDEKRKKDREYYHKTKERRSELNKLRYQKDQHSFYLNNRNSVLKRKYGLNLKAYEQLLTTQDYKCAICLSETEQTLAVDHCHDTGVVRGLLCGSCNRALGLFKENHEIVNRAAKYLKRFI